MVIYDNKNDCCGCTACLNSCPTQAISLKEDNEGFLYPVINDFLCTKCKLCIKVCPFKKYKKNDFQQKIYAVKHKDQEILFKSSSGGAFTALSDYVLANNGVVYGASFDKSFKVIHSRAINKEDRNLMRGSKYVQSFLGNCFIKVKKDLEENKLVLFTGTPCACAGLNNYLNKEYQNLFICDIICHGVPSPKIFKDYIHFISNKKIISELNFRSKKAGWRGYNIYLKKNNKEILNNSNSKSFLDLFSNVGLLRPSCHNCKFCNFNRPSDITIADFWGIEKCKPHMDDNKGVSLILLNSIKGQTLFNNIKDNVYYEESNKDECLQHNLIKPSLISPIREKVFLDYEKKGYVYIAKKYTAYGFIYRLKRKIKVLIKKILIKIGLNNK